MSPTPPVAARLAHPRVNDLLPVPVLGGEVRVSGIAIDSRQVCQGGLFLACRGVSGLHGLSFVEQALANGAAAVAFEPDDALAIPT